MKLRKFADIFAYVNYTSYKELTYFENYLVRSFISNFEDMGSKSIEQITKNHLLVAEMLSNFTDIKKVCFRSTTVVAS